MYKMDIVTSSINSETLRSVFPHFDGKAYRSIARILLIQDVSACPKPRLGQACLTLDMLSDSKLILPHQVIGQHELCYESPGLLPHWFLMFFLTTLCDKYVSMSWETWVVWMAQTRKMRLSSSSTLTLVRKPRSNKAPIDLPSIATSSLINFEDEKSLLVWDLARTEPFRAISAPN